MNSLTALTNNEVISVLFHLKRLAGRSASTRQNLLLFRLATCCGLRASEICALNVGDILDGPSPRVLVRCGKGSKRREIPLYWDIETLECLVSYVAWRRRNGAVGGDPLLLNRRGGRMSRQRVWERFSRVCRKWAGRHAPTHAGRHTWISTALRSRSIVAVRDAAGHSSIATTNRYAHDLEADQTPGSLFASS